MSDLFLERDAVISDCGRYRYLLRRAWDHDRPRALFVMLNPSTADAELDDPTIRSCARLCRAWGFGSFEVVNLYGWRATQPEELGGKTDPIGPRNDTIMEAAINRCDVVICAWGAHHHPFGGERVNTVYGLIQQHRPLAYCLGLTKDGHPKHPLYIKTGTPLVAFQPGAAGTMEQAA